MGLTPGGRADKWPEVQSKDPEIQLVKRDVESKVMPRGTQNSGHRNFKHCYNNEKKRFGIMYSFAK